MAATFEASADASPKAKEGAAPATRTPQGLERALEAYRKQGAAFEAREAALEKTRANPFVDGANIKRRIVDMTV